MTLAVYCPKDSLLGGARRSFVAGVPPKSPDGSKLSLLKLLFFPQHLRALLTLITAHVMNSPANTA